MVAIVPNLVDAPELTTLAIILWVALCVFVSLLDRTPRSYMFVLSGYTAALIGFPSVLSPARCSTPQCRASRRSRSVLSAPRLFTVLSFLKARFQPFEKN